VRVLEPPPAIAAARVVQTIARMDTYRQMEARARTRMQVDAEPVVKDEIYTYTQIYRYNHT
jgi:hypothetical protein